MFPYFVERVEKEIYIWAPPNRLYSLESKREVEVGSLRNKCTWVQMIRVLRTKLYIFY